MAPERSSWLLSKEKVLDSCVRRLARLSCLRGSTDPPCRRSHQAAPRPSQASPRRSLSSSSGPNSGAGGGSAAGSEPRSLGCRSRPSAMAVRRTSGTFPPTYWASSRGSSRRWEKVGAAQTGGVGGTSSKASSHRAQQAVAWGVQEVGHVGGLFGEVWQSGTSLSWPGLELVWRWRYW